MEIEVTMPYRRAKTMLKNGYPGMIKKIFLAWKRHKAKVKSLNLTDAEVALVFELWRNDLVDLRFNTKYL